MADLLNLAQFSSLLHRTFEVREDGFAIDLVLIEAESLKPRPGQLRESFALLFRGPMQPILAQRLYPLRHESLGTLEIFLVPVGPDQTGQRYEAIFN